jgi:PAS domain S-box-containing protein
LSRNTYSVVWIKRALRGGITSASMSDLQKRSILVVDDEALITQTISGILQKHGYSTFNAASAEEALKVVQQAQRPDLILMDIELGAGMDGVQSAEIIIREFGIPVLFLSSHTEPEFVTRTENVSSYGFVVKNAGETVLIASVKMAFRLYDARKAAEDRELALRASETQYRSLFDGAPVGYHELDTDGRITNINRTELQMLGYDHSEMVGQPIWKFIVEPESQAATTAKLAGRLQPGQTYESTFRRKDGSTFSAYLDDGLLKDGNGTTIGIRSTLQDVSHHKEVERRLHESEERYRILIENAAEVIVVIQNGIVRFVNSQGEKLSGYSKRELIGKPVFELSRPQDHERVRMIHQLRLQGAPLPPGAEISRIVRKSGETRWVEVKSTVITWGGMPATLHFYTDITDRKQAEDALALALEEKGVLLKELQHRIKNSLTMITSLIGLESGRVSDAFAQTVLDHLRDRVSSLTRLYALMDRTGEIQRIHVGDYFKNIVESLSATYIRERSNIQIEQLYEPVEIDAKMAAPCGLILNELLTNALKFAFPNEQRGHIWIEVADHGKELLMKVSDDGVGPPPGFSIEQSSGFGMRIIQLLVEQLRGRISFARNDRTIFTTSFPRI